MGVNRPSRGAARDDQPRADAWPHGVRQPCIRILLAAIGSAVVLGACGGGPARPSLQGLTLALPASAPGRLLACAGCEIDSWVSAEFAVVVGDPYGSGGTIESVQTTAMNVSRGMSLASNTRPNLDFAYPATTLLAGGTLQLTAGVVIAPPPPPRDQVMLNVLVTLTDGRKTVGSVPLVVTAD